jgi:hypothetical protein
MLGHCWQGLPCTGCGSACGVFTAANGTFSDGSGPSDYSNNVFCQWIIAPSGATQVSINFTALNTESCCDFIRVYECTSLDCAARKEISQLSGTYDTVQTVTANTGYMLVHFTTDASATFGGFTANWRGNFNGNFGGKSCVRVFDMRNTRYVRKGLLC